MDLHRRIRTLRLRKGMTGGELAERAGISASYVSLIEHGDKIPSESKATAIARALGEPEELYRVWSVTSRLSEQTRAAMRSHGALGGDDPAPPGTNGATTVPPPLHRPPGRPPLDESLGFSPAYSLHDEPMAPMLRVPLLAPGPVSDENPPPEQTIEAVVGLDARLLERDSNAGLVALRLNSHNARFVAGMLKPLDLVVIDRNGRRLDPANVYAWKLEDGLTLSRAAFVGGGAMLLPTGDGQAPVTIDAATPESLHRLLYGTVIWMARRWAAR